MGFSEAKFKYVGKVLKNNKILGLQKRSPSLTNMIKLTIVLKQRERDGRRILFTTLATSVSSSDSTF
jgi:hypothetical protein